MTVFDGSEQGAVAVRFKEADDAERCAAMMDARTFGQGTHPQGLQQPYLTLPYRLV